MRHAEIKPKLLGSIRPLDQPSGKTHWSGRRNVIRAGEHRLCGARTVLLHLHRDACVVGDGELRMPAREVETLKFTLPENVGEYI